MADRIEQLAGEIITEAELGALRLVTDAYGARAKQAAAELAARAGFSEVGAREFLGWIGAGLLSLDFSQRQDLIGHLGGLMALLGNKVEVQTHQSSSDPTDILSNGRQAEAQDSPEVTPAPQEDVKEVVIAPSAASIVDATRTERLVPFGKGPGTEESPESPPATDETAKAEPYRFDSLQQRFLEGIFGDLIIDQYGMLTEAEFHELMELLIAHYEGLKIPRLSPEAKTTRGEQIWKLIVERKPVKVVAEDYNLTYHNLRLGAKTAIGSITQRTTREELQAMIAQAKTKPSAETSEPADLTPTKKLEEVINQLAEVLFYDESERRILYGVFDTCANEIDVSPDTTKVREDLMTIYEVSRHNAILHPLESKVLDMILSQKPKTIDSIGLIYAEELKQRGQAIEELLHGTLDKIVKERKRIIDAGRRRLIA